MTNFPFISICVPAYKRINYLERLLKSIQIQTYTHFEVVVSDDTPGEGLVDFLKQYQDILPIRYFKNETALGTPENWNEAIRQAKGEWIKIMHDDDWFTDSNSLKVFAETIVSNQSTDFFFSAYNNIYEEENNRLETVRLSPRNERKLHANVLNFFRANFVGNPSCTLYRKNESIMFDKTFKWVVDFEFYIRYLSSSQDFIYIDQPLVNVGMNASQVTKYTFRVGEVEIPENHKMLAKLGFDKLKNIFVYDYFWRLYRNIGIRRIEQLLANGYTGNISPVMASMINWQSKFPASFLRKGIFSKALMVLHYLTHYFSINDSAINYHSKP